MGISNGYLSLIEQGNVVSPSPRYLMAMANHYELPFDRLMALAGHPSGSEPASASRGPRVALSAGGDPVAGDVRGPQRAFVGGRDEEASISSQVTGADQDSGMAVINAGAYGVSDQEPIKSTETAERQQLTALVLDDLHVLSVADIAQVRAFITGLRAARRR